MRFLSFQKPLIRGMVRGFLKRCPQCGGGNLLYRYLKIVPNCPLCAEPLDHYSADDAPPYLTLFIVGHGVIPVLLYLDRVWHFSSPLLMGIGCVLGAVLTGILLPSIKGMVVGILWALQKTEHP